MEASEPPPSEPPPSEPPPIPISSRSAYLSRVHFGVIIPLIVACVSVYGLRMYLRMRPVWKIGWEDYCITIGLALALLDFGFLVPEQHTHDGLISSETGMRGIKYAFLAIITWGIAMMFIKISVIIMLLRIPIDVGWRLFWWRVFWWLMIFIQLAWCVGNTTFVLLQCRPIEAQWNPAVLAEGGSCLSVKTSGMASNAAAGVNICTDILISLAPAIFLWRMRLPAREKVLIGVLMSLGLFASVSSIIKMTLVEKFTEGAGDIWAVAISISTYTMLEQLLALTAASAPYLKPLLQRTMHRFGVSFFETGTHASFRRAVGESTLGREAVECHVPAEDTDEPILLEQGGAVSKEKDQPCESYRVTAVTESDVKPPEHPV